MRIKDSRYQLRLQLEQTVDILSMQQSHNSIIEHNRDMPHVEALQAFERLDRHPHRR